LSSGCYTESTYTDEHATARCTLYQDCGYLETQLFDSYEECYNDLIVKFNPDNQEGCDFDPTSARDCVKYINLMVCEDLYESDFPSACERVCD